MSDEDSGQTFSATLQSLLPTLMLMNGRGGADTQWIGLVCALILPLLLQSVLPMLKKWARHGMKLFRTGCSRTVQWTRDPSVWWDDKENEEAFNGVVQRSILKYINQELPEVAKGWTESNVQVR